MKSKIYKISFVLIFMLFVTGLFNFCFAISYNEDRVICSTFPIPEITKANSNYSSLSSSSSTKKALDNYFNNNVGTYPNVDSVLYFKNPDGQYMAFLEQEYDLSSGDNICILYSNQIKYSTTQNYQGYGIIFIYDESSNKWIFSEGSKNSYAITLPIEIDYRSTTILANDTKKSTIYYEYTGVPLTNEELIANCDFKVNFKFKPDNDDYPASVDKHWYVYETCLVTHSMSNWSNYKVSMSISANKENSRGGANTYFELYNGNGDKLIDKHNLENNVAVGEDLSEGDFYLLLTDNITDVMTITYNIYNNNDELLLRKEYKLKFTQGGFGAVDFTGTIIQNNTYDSNGDIVSDTNTGFETNGNDATTGIGTSDYYDVSDLELITNNATNTINLAKQCFAILPGFIWVMVGIFLSVCLALRILGR